MGFVLCIKDIKTSKWLLQKKCSGQVILAADLEEFQKSSSALFGVNLPLC